MRAITAPRVVHLKLKANQNADPNMLYKTGMYTIYFTSVIEVYQKACNIQHPIYSKEKFQNGGGAKIVQYSYIEDQFCTREMEEKRKYSRGEGKYYIREQNPEQGTFVTAIGRGNIL